MALPETFAELIDERTPASEQPFSARAVLEIVQALALAVIISVILNLFVVQVTEVRQRSMEPTLLQGDRVLVSKVGYRFGSPRQGDIIVFTPPIDSTIPYVKRVIATAGETVELRDGKVLVNGKVVEFPDAIGASLPQAPAIRYPFTLPAGMVWTMGDNRLASSDSRSFGPVPVENVIGKVVVRFWPFDRVKGFSW